MLPVVVHVPTAGSYNSALLKEVVPLSPPATSTLPDGSCVAVCSSRAMARPPVAVQLPVAGSYSSALVKALLILEPPATSTLPEGSSVAVWERRSWLRLPVCRPRPHRRIIQFRAVQETAPTDSDS